MGSEQDIQWPFFEWGASAVMAGHDHHYERIEVGNGLYFVNGLGGNSKKYTVGRPVDGSIKRFNDSHGAMRVTATEQRIVFEFLTASGDVVDRKELAGED